MVFLFLRLIDTQDFQLTLFPQFNNLAEMLVVDVRLTLL